MGATYWKFDGVSCQIEMVGVLQLSPSDAENNIECDCQLVITLVTLTLKGYSLPGVLPPELVKLPYLRRINFAYNYLSGGIPAEWAPMQLESISLLVNQLSGEVPKMLGNITTLTYLNLEANGFTGTVPDELGKLVNLESLILSSNKLTGMLPVTLARLKNLTDFRINDNNFRGVIPSFIQSWKQLKRLEMHVSGLVGPIPSVLSLVDKVTELRISDISGSTQSFPDLSNMAILDTLISQFVEPPTEEKLTAMERAMKIQANLSAAYPSFVKMMIPSNVSGSFWMHPPRKTSNANLPKEDCTIALVDEAGKEVNTKYLARKYGLSAGWSGFAIQSALQKGDVLVC